ncbi:MAG: carbohydrate ABC transporter permease [Treponema sp.]|jgi:ABC-type glycerol-3-phosphate transport system permease component|nr:carbohydrate ABC transporter permease [Treponema sp.]
MNSLSARRKASSGKAIVYIVLFYGVFAVSIPILWMLSTSLKTMVEIMSSRVNIIPGNATIQAYLSIWKNYDMFLWLKNSLIVVVFSTLCALFFSTLAGYGSSRFRFRGKGTFLSFLLVTQMFPAIMLLIPYYKVLQTIHLINRLSGLVVVYTSFSIPLLTWMMMGYFETIPKELDEAALIDGCSRLRTFFQIILPLTLPGLISATIYAFIHGWNEYMFALILISNDSLKTLPVGIAQMNGFYKIEWNELMAASIVSSIPLLLIFLFLQRYFVSSLTAGAVKQ